MKLRVKFTYTEVVSGADSTVRSVTCTRVQMHLMCATDREKQPKPTNNGEFTCKKLEKVPQLDFEQKS